MTRRLLFLSSRDNILKGLALLLLLISVLSIIGAAIFLHLNRSITPYIYFPGHYDEYTISLVYGIVGLLILLYRPRHAIGWIFLFVGLMGSLSSFAQGYAIYSMITGANELPGGHFAGWFQQWASGTLVFMPILLLMMLFPDGHLPSRRWLPLAVLTVLVGALLILGTLIEPGRVFVWIGDTPTMLPMNNPTGISLSPMIREFFGIGWFAGIIILPAAILAPILRFRHAQGVQRQQLKWFAYFSVFTLLLLPLLFLFSNTLKIIDSDLVGEFILALALLILPLATTVAILRHGLYDIDVIIKRTLIYFVLTLILVGIYLASVILLQYLFTAVAGQESPVAIVISTLIIAALFNPLRHRVQDLIDRRFFRSKYDAALTLNHFAEKARDEVDLDQLSAELLRVVQETMQPDQASLWLKPASGNQRNPAGKT
jgi:hypothetical protein